MYNVCPMKTSLTLIIAGMSVLGASAITPSQIRWSGAPTDSSTVESIMLRSRVELPRGGANERMATIALNLVERPYAAGTLEGTDPEMLTVRLDSLDCTTFVESAMAMAIVAAEHSDPSWRDFVSQLEEVRYRRGRLDGYPSRLHYVSDWIVDNTSRGKLTEVTANLQTASHVVKTLDYMSRHASAYPALKNPSNLERIKGIEMGYRSHRYSIVKSTKVNRAVLDALMPGDIIAFTSGLEGLDVAHMGLIVKGEDGQPKLLHASSAVGKVIIDPLPLPDYLKRHRQFTGIRVLRLRPLVD